METLDILKRMKNGRDSKINIQNVLWSFWISWCSPNWNNTFILFDAKNLPLLFPPFQSMSRFSAALQNVHHYCMYLRQNGPTIKSHFFYCARALKIRSHIFPWLLHQCTVSFAPFSFKRKGISNSTYFKIVKFDKNCQNCFFFPVKNEGTFFIHK